MKKVITYILVGVVCLLIGAGTICGLVYLYPNEVVKTITEKNVSITDTGIAESVDKIKDAVVVIEATKNNSTSTGTGFVYDTDGSDAFIMTNHHVIEDASKIQITYSDDTVTEATLVGSDEYADIAVLKVSKSTILGVASIGKSEDVRVGDTVFTIGSPMGKNYRGTVTRGILSGKNRLVSVAVGSNSADWIMNVMQTDAAINPGNSGGPLCNINGEVIGVNSMKIVEETIEGIGFSIPIEEATKFASDLRSNGSISRPYVGVTMLNVSNRMQLAYAGISIPNNVKKGVVIYELEKNSPGDKAGLKVGDIVIEIEGKEVDDMAEFRYRLYSYSPKDTIKFKVVRDGKEKEIKVTLGSGN